MKSIGLIADTHGSIHPDVFRAFAEMDLILHAGDVDSPHVASDLEALAPVLAVRGSMDAAPLLSGLPRIRVLEIGGCWIAVIHNLKLLRRELQPFGKSVAHLQVVVHGHTHLAEKRIQRGTLLVNPGAAEWQSLGARKSKAGYVWSTFHLLPMENEIGVILSAAVGEGFRA